MSDNVEVVLSVDDQASSAVAKAASKVSSIDTSAKASKPHIISLEKAGRSAGDALSRIGDTLNVPELGRASGAIGGIAEQLQTAKEAANGMKLGFVGTIGVIGGVAAGAVGIGKAIGDVVFATAAWEQKLQSALSISQQLADRQARMADRSFGDQLAKLELADAPDSSYRAMISKLKQEAQGVSRSLNAELSKIDALSVPGLSYIYSNEIKIRQNSANLLQQQLEQLKEQETAVERILTVERELNKERDRKKQIEEENKIIQQLKDELDLLSATGAERHKLAAEQSSFTIAGAAEIQLLSMAKEQAEKKKVVDEIIAKEKQLIDIRETQLKLGKSEAEDRKKYLELIEAGVSDKVARDIVRENARISDAEKLKKPPAELRAFESRLLTRGPGQAISEETKAIRDLIKEMKEQRKIHEKSSQDLNMIMRDRGFIAAPKGRR